MQLRQVRTGNVAVLMDFCTALAASAANSGAMTVRKLVAVPELPSNGNISSPSVPNHSDIMDLLSHVARRDRFTFQPNHLEILERAFTEDLYPVYEKREHIANLCNLSTESLCKFYFL